jgi:high-affinity nickel-transport protein
MANFNINTAGFVIVGMFIVTWGGALAFLKFGHVEEKWSAKLKHPPPAVATIDPESPN